MMAPKINWFGLAGGALVLALIVVSLFVPWWQLIIGDDLVTTNVSPLNTNFDLMGTSLSIPLIFALNIASLVSLAAGGIVMLIYSIKPLESYSNKLLGFAYRKPLFSVVFFLAGLFLTITVIGSLFSVNVPLLGSQVTTLPMEYTQGITLRVLMNAGFQWPFLMALASAGLCVGARFYHKKIV